MIPVLNLNIYSLLILLLCAVDLQQENTTLQDPNKENICVVEKDKEFDSLFSAGQPKYSKDLLSSDRWENDDWVIKESSNLITRPNFEEHFSGWNIKKRDAFSVNLLSSYSFSVNETSEITFFASEGSAHDRYQHKINDTEIWTTFTLCVNDGKLLYYENYTNIRHVLLVPTTLYIQTLTANFKIYDYEFKEASDITKEYTNILKIPGSEEVDLILSVSLCRSCVLVVTYNDHNCFIFSSNDESNERWGRHKIKINPKISNQVMFSRIQNNPTEKGYWRLHLTATLVNNAVATSNHTIASTIPTIILLLFMYDCTGLKF
ncbi:uncharacterized protein LOC135138785 [Zophobas morio]|uniref:uncharacterized protein LOC135138785 n=1 Tax=Zophobas morio TaxID=2755281 RepID=UPI0030833A02